MKRLQCIEISHKTARVALRERFVPLVAESRMCLPAETVFLSTCGRLELYVAGTPRSREAWLRWLSARCGTAARDLGNGWRSRVEDDAARHLLRVAAGLESPILGEDQILGQVRSAFLQAQERASTGPLLSALFRAAIHAGRRVRNETDLGSAVRSYAQRAVDSLAATPEALRRTVVIGSGTVASDLSERLAGLGSIPTAIVSGHPRHAMALAARVGSRAVGRESLRAVLESADCLVACTSASSPVVHVEHLTERSRPLRVIDLGVPRNVTPAVGLLPGVELIDLDGLLGGPGVPAEQIAAADEIVEHEARRFARWLHARRCFRNDSLQTQEAAA